MNGKRIYITASACIPARHTSGTDLRSNRAVSFRESMPWGAEPNYGDYIDAKNIRRLNRMQKMGIAAAVQCLQMAGIDKPDGIVMGTGWGCIDSTYRVLDRLYNLQGLPVHPSAFIQSTHNAVAAQIAMQLSCRGYNNTFTDNRLAFDLALDDALLYLYDSEAQYLLLGAIDELTPELADIVSYIRRPNTGTVPGEGCIFFALSTHWQANAIEIVHTGIGCIAEIEEKLPELFSRFAIDGVFAPTRKALDHFRFFEGHKTAYEEYCGSYPTNSAFGLWLAIEHIASRNRENPPQSAPDNRCILLYTPSRNKQCAVTVISGVEGAAGIALPETSRRHTAYS